MLKLQLFKCSSLHIILRKLNFKFMQHFIQSTCITVFVINLFFQMIV